MLAKARAEADARYNQALSAVDAALLAVREAPHPPPAPDETQITPLNERWRILPEAPPIDGNWLQRKLAGLAWRVVAPIFERQQAFNAALVDHVNRSVPVDRATRESIDAALRFTSDALGELARLPLGADRLLPAAHRLRRHQGPRVRRPHPRPLHRAWTAPSPA